MKEENKVYLFGAYFGNKKDGSRVFANYILVFQSMPSLYDIMNELKRGDKELVISTILSMQFLTKEQYYALKGEKPDEQQS